MAINVSQAFHRTSANPVDDTLTLTKAQMLEVNDHLMPDKYLTVCQDDGFIYLYDKSATASPTTGKFTKFEGGGSGGGALADLTDVDLENLADGQILVWDDTNSKWVNQSGGAGGDAELSEAVTANTAAGAIEVGTTLPQGMTFTEFAKALLIAEVDPTINFSISQSGTVPSGSSYTETLTCAVTNMGSATKIKTISWYEGETLKRTDNVNSTIPATWTYTMPTATTDTTTFKAVVTYTNSKGIDISTEKTATITFGSYKYYGAVSSLTPTEQEIKALTSVAATSKSGKYYYTLDDERTCYAYPKSFGLLTAITDPNGFNLMESMTRSEMTMTFDGQSVDYYLYILTDEVSIDNAPITYT